MITSDEAEIARLQQRIRELEAAGETPDYTVPTDAGAAARPGSQYPADHPYNQEYRFPESAQKSAAPVPAVKAQPEYPVYSPFGPPAEFPPLAPDDAAPADVGAVAPVAEPAAPAAAVVPAAPQSVAVEAAPAPAPAPAGGVVDYTPGNPAAYVPPMQNTGQRVYDLGR